jgi:parvulin-like peptidyl-prolyl isomerase
LQRLALLGFGALLLILFLGFAIAQGLGHPDVPSGAVAVIEEVPEDLGTITEEELKRGIVQTARQNGIKPVPKPGDPPYDELEKRVLSELFERVWIQGEAEELGLTATPEEVADELEKLKEPAFKTEAQYQEFLKKTTFTQADVDELVKIQILTKKIQEQSAEVPPPGKEEIEEYYEEAKSTQFTSPETRDARIIVNKDKAKVEEALDLLEGDTTEENWKRVAAKYSTEKATKDKGGLRPTIFEGSLPGLDEAIFDAPPAELEGPINAPQGWAIFEVVKVTEKSVQPLAEVESQVSAQLSQRAQQAASERFAVAFGSKWNSRTFCAPEFTIERCANFKGNGRPLGAPPGCYEEDPKAPAPEGCPAPVTQTKPMLPGTNSILEPQGEKQAIEGHPPQRPRPSKLEAAAPEGATGIPPITPGE